MSGLDRLDKYREARIREILNDVPSYADESRYLAERVYDLERLVFQVNGDTIEVGLNLAQFIARQEMKECE